MTVPLPPALPLPDQADVLQETVQDIGENSLNNKRKCICDACKSDPFVPEEVLVVIHNAITGEKVIQLSELPDAVTVKDVKIACEDVFGQDRCCQRFMVSGAVEVLADHVRINSLGTAPLQLQWILTTRTPAVVRSQTKRSCH